MADLTVTANIIATNNVNDSIATRDAINQLATQNAQSTANAPTNTPEPSPIPSDTPMPSPTPLPPVDVNVGQLNIGLSSTLYVRSLPSTSSRSVTVISPGDLMAILNTVNDWLEIELLENGVRGWVSSTYVNSIGDFSPSQLDGVADAYTLVSSSDEWLPVVEEFDGVPMVLAPVGCFNFGITDAEINIMSDLNLDESATLDELPDATVCLNRPFWIDQYEVSQAQFIAFGGETEGTPQFIGADLPQTSISWAEAKAFCELRGAYLPSEVQWEYAARGVNRFLFPWGNRFESNFYNWNRSNDIDEIEPVTNYPEGASWIGAYQMQGNVSEWTLSAYFAYPLPTISRIFLSDFGV
ncbi:MAG: SUMF1/EgtB/PvdO family nonheme iron enzyme, partial [Chloroflexota bacterium]